MTVAAPSRPPKELDPIDHDELEALVEALIEEARQHQRRRRVWWAVAPARGNTALVRANPRIAFMTVTTSPPWATTLNVVNADGSGRKILTRAAWNVEAPAWSPDGRRLAFERRVSPLNNGQCACDIDIFAMNADGSDQQNLTRNPVYDRRPVWSADGQQIAFVRYRDVWVVNADGSEQRPLTANARATKTLFGRPMGAASPTSAFVASTGTSGS